MEFSRELLFFFSALGAFNGLLMGLYFIFFAKPKSNSNLFLGVLLFTLSIRIGKSVFYYFNPDLAEIFLQIGISSVAFVGPSLFFYLKSLTDDRSQKKAAIYHYLFILFAVLTIGIIYPWEAYPHTWWYVVDIIYFQWMIYLVVAGSLIKPQLLQIFKLGSKLSSSEIWILSIYLGNVIIWFTYNTAYYTSYITGALSFTFIFYLLILLVFFTRKTDGQFLRRPVKYGDKKIDEEEASVLSEQLNTLLIEQKLYQDPNLKLPDVAKELNIIPHRLSQLINDNLEKNFTLLINEYRVKHAKELIESNTHLKLESIGYECGFNSKSTFYTAFKKLTGTTPAKFQAELVGG